MFLWKHGGLSNWILDYLQANIGFMINIEKFKVHKRFRDIQDSTVPGLSIVNRFVLLLVF